MRFSCDSALTYTGTESQPEDWIDTHERTAQLIIELQRHAKAVADHLAHLDTKEVVSSLRSYTEDRFQKNEEIVVNHKNLSDEQFAATIPKFERLNNYIEQVESTNAQFRKAYTEDMEKVTLRDLIPCLTEEDIKPYTEDGEVSYVIQADPKLNPKARQARMFTLDQLQHLFNVQFKRTHLLKRMTVNEAAVRELEEKVAALEKWRPDIEERIV